MDKWAGRYIGENNCHKQIKEKRMKKKKNNKKKQGWLERPLEQH